MSEITVLHNPRCSTSRSAVDAVTASGLDPKIRNYLVDPLSKEEWLEIIGLLVVEPTQLVRRDANFARLEIDEREIVTADQVASVLETHPVLAQRPVLIRGGHAIIGRPKSVVGPFLG